MEYIYYDYFDKYNNDRAVLLKESKISAQMFT